MASRPKSKLTARTVETLKVPGRHSDGGGLYLHISDAGGVAGRRWIFRFTAPATGKVREMGLGSAAKGNTSLSQARDLAAAARALVRSGVDPIDARAAHDVRVEQERLAGRTFGEVADEYVEAMAPSWRNEKHVAQWRMTLKDYATPLRSKRVGDITTDDVLKVLQPIWSAKPETAVRLRGRIEAVLDAAAAKGFRHGENPARWRGHLAKLLPKRQRLSRGHHKALPYADMPAFMAKLRTAVGMSARVLEFTILTATRSGEALGARWGEVDLAAATWTVPAERMKAGREHRVPLPARAIEIIQGLSGLSDDYIFPGQKKGRPLSVMAMTVLLRRLGFGHVTVHGFRSAFSDWCSETTGFPSEVREMALAHTIPNKAEAAYRRGDLFQKRAELMAAWAAWCEPAETDGRVVPMRRTDVPA